MTIDIAAIKARAEAATAAPWTRHKADVFGPTDQRGKMPLIAVCFHELGYQGMTHEQCVANACFIEQAKSDVRSLCDEVERLRTVLENVRNVRDKAVSAVTDAREERDEARAVARRLHRYENDSHDVKDDAFRAATKAIARWDAEKKGGGA